MRILLVSHGLPPDSVGGVEQHVSGLASALVEQGHEVDILARAHLPNRPQGSWERSETGNPSAWRIAYRWEDVDSLDAMYTCAPMAESTRAFLQERAAEGVTYDAAHVHHLTGLSLGCVDVLRKAEVRVVFTLHDYWMMCARGQMFHDDGTACAAIDLDRCTPCLSATWPGPLPLDDAARARWR